jgi:sugar phosphate permease
MPDNWRVVALLCLTSGVAYLVRSDIAIAQERMAPALQLTMADMSAITASAVRSHDDEWQSPVCSVQRCLR